MKNLWILILILLLGGCAAGTTEQGNTTRTYEDIAPMEIVNSGSNSFSNITIESDLTGSSQQETTMGDASASWENLFSAAWEAAQGMAVKDGLAFMKDIAPILEKWIETTTDSGNTEIVDDSPSPPPSPPNPDTTPPGDGESPNEPVEPSEPGVVATAVCDDTMSYRECETCESVPQIVCMFDQYESCSDVPVDSFTLQFLATDGEVRELEVPDKCSIAMGGESEGFIKWRYAHDKEPFKPVGYAPRYFAAVEAKILGKMDSSTGWRVVQWGGKDPDPDHDRRWWTKIHGETDKWWRKFPLDRSIDDSCDEYEFIFSSGRRFIVPNSCEMAMDADGPKYRPETPGEANPSKQHPKISEEYNRKESWVKYRKVK